MTKMPLLHRLSLTAFAAVCPFAFGAAAQTPAAPSQVLNRAYVSSCGRDTPATLHLKDGKFGRYLLLADEDRRTELIVLGAEKIHVAGDRRRHYAVFAKCEVLGKHGYELFVLRNTGKRIIQIASAVTPGVANLYGVKQIHQSKGQIIVALDHLRSSRSTAVERYEFEFRLTGTTLELVSHRLAAK